MDQEGRPVSEPEGNTEAYGTPRYISPEQEVDGPVSPASDVYSLGVAMEDSFRTDYKKPAE
jgi:serine/threonine protein kinase